MTCSPCGRRQPTLVDALRSDDNNQQHQRRRRRPVWLRTSCCCRTGTRWAWKATDEDGRRYAAARDELLRVDATTRGRDGGPAPRYSVCAGKMTSMFSLNEDDDDDAEHRVGALGCCLGRTRRGGTGAAPTGRGARHGHSPSTGCVCRHTRRVSQDDDENNTVASDR